MKEEGPLTTETVDALNAHAEPLTMGSDPRRLLELSQSACDLARGLSYRKGEAYALTYLGFAHWYSGELEKALEDLTTALALFESMEDPVGLAKARVALLSVQKSLGVYDQSLEHNLACLKFFRDSGDRIWEGACLLALGSLFYDTGDVQKSMQHYQNAAGVAEAIPEPQRAWMLGRALVGMGSGYQRLGDHERALEHYEKSLPLFESGANAMGEARVLNDIGVVHQNLGRDESAVDFHLRSLAIRRQIGQREAQITSLLNIGRLYVRLGDGSKALPVLEEALLIACEIQSKPKTFSCHQALSEAYELVGDLASALEHHRRFESVKAEVFNDEAGARLKNLQTRFELEAAEREAEIVQSKNQELEGKNRELQELLGELRRTQAQLVHAEKMASLGRLVAGLAHELNNPIGALRSASRTASLCAEKLAALLNLEENQPARGAVMMTRESAQIIAEATGRMMALLESLKSFSRLDEAALQRTDVRAGIDSALELLRSELQGRVSVVKEYGDVPELTCYPGELNQVFMTLLTNAAEAIEGAGTIRIGVHQAGEVVRIQFSDDGRGIPPEKLGRLFDFDFSSGGPRVKMSSSLVTARNIVTKHRGEISVESHLGRGTRFTIELPVHVPTG